MKKYFSKYLPVGGDIKEGDWCIAKQTVLSNNHSKHYIRETYADLVQYSKARVETSGRYDTIEFQKVKFFLCSRDIQGGDEVSHCKSGEVAIVGGLSDNDVILKDHHWPHSNKEDWYKIIGEISPEAVWVEEAMQFDEQQWRPYNKEFDIVLDKKYAGDKEVSYIQILGSCGHFH